MMFSKKKQLAYRKKGKNAQKTINIPESAIQKQADDMLDNLGIDYIRMPDSLWLWVKQNAPVHITSLFARCFGGIPDNTCFIPISDKYSLCLHLELKSAKGKLHGKQKAKARHLPYQISRSPDETIDIINKFIEAAERLERVVENDS